MAVNKSGWSVSYDREFFGRRGKGGACGGGRGKEVFEGEIFIFKGIVL